MYFTVIVILCVVYYFERVFVILCIVVPLPPGINPFAVNNSNNNILVMSHTTRNTLSSFGVCLPSSFLS
jgi:hypothetical protein